MLLRPYSKKSKGRLSDADVIDFVTNSRERKSREEAERAAYKETAKDIGKIKLSETISNMSALWSPENLALGEHCVTSGQLNFHALVGDLSDSRYGVSERPLISAGPHRTRRRMSDRKCCA